MHLDYPTVPFCGPLNQQLQPGAVIQAKGQSNPNADYFAIAFQCGPSTTFSDDVALYLSFAFSPPPRIIRNSLIDGQWGPEESFGGFPSAVGQLFEIIILVEPEYFKIAINGQHFTEFKHRIYFERINHVHITGDVRIDSFSVWYGQQQQSNPAPYPPSNSLYPTLPNDLPPKPGFYDPYVPNPAPYTAGPAVAPYPPAQPYPAPPPYSSYDPNQNPYPPAQPYPQQQPYPSPQQPYYPSNDPSQNKNKNSGGIGGMVGSALTGLTAGAIGSRVLGGKHSMVPNIVSNALGGGGHHGSSGYPSGGGYGHHKQKKSSGLPIAGIAAGVGAAALGAALIGGLNPVKKVFKHKHHFGRHSSSSSSSSEEE